MKRLILIALALYGVYACTGVTQAEAPDRTLNEYSVQELVSHFATQYQVSEPKMLGTMNCESGFNPNAIGDNGKSIGAVQIYLPAHPEVRKDQAFDKVFATEFMAKEFSKHHQRIWSCYRMLYP